ncbi:MAG: diadenylate cyclase CdaA [Lachnospiraceae bacterium]|nr:diadenylate cyclase CdaA [Lachnospiraceae bacterium]
MQDRLSTAVDHVERILSTMKIGDMMEILIIAFLVYHIILWIQASRAWYLLKGLAVVGGFWLLAAFFKMHTILWLAENIAPFAVTAIVVVLQPEIRRALEDLGKRNVLTSLIPFDSSRKVDSVFDEKTINEITKACMEMGKAKTGALIVIEHKVPLSDYERTGIDVDGMVTNQLLINIFEHNTPLHDGAVIIRGNRITSATCYLPLTDNMDLGKELGTRHRAGIGISEVTDSLTVIVSEETGRISVAEGGRLDRMNDAEMLKARLRTLLVTPEEEEKGKHRRKGRSKDEK